jgi:aspartokinase/homoserine dehydrogenase 1
MSCTPGVAAKIFSALSAKKINIRAIAQGSSERNVSAIIDQKDADAALNAVHDYFVTQDSQITCW